MHPLAKNFTPILVSNVEKLETPKERCAECGEIFRHEKNPEFILDDSKVLPRAVLGRLAWRAISHLKCDELAHERERAAAAHILKRSGFPGNT